MVLTSLSFEKGRVSRLTPFEERGLDSNET